MEQVIKSQLALLAGGSRSGASRPAIYRTYGKRLFDVASVLAVMPVLLPLCALMSIAILMTGQNPFYTQQRVGPGGQSFRMWKFQTMLPNADALLAEHLRNNPSAKLEWDDKQKLRRDPRVTRLGHALRRTSLDELPQLINVLNGTMSLVGPRPMMVEQKALYHGEAYYRVRPGLTGPWQVSDRNACSFVGRVAFDEDYAAQISLAGDLRCLWCTVKVIFKRTGC